MQAFGKKKPLEDLSNQKKYNLQLEAQAVKKKERKKEKTENRAS